MIRWLPFLTVLTLVAACGCDADQPGDSNKDSSKVKGQPMLSASEAQQALVAMAEQSSDTFLKEQALPRLKAAKPSQRADGIILVDDWECDLAERTFGFSLVAPPRLLEYLGKFTKGADGKWTATVTRKRET
jgi:hypothetical protein